MACPTARARPPARQNRAAASGASCAPRRGGRQLFGAGQARRRADRPNPTDRDKPGTKYHVIATDGLPLGAAPSAANVHETRLVRHLLRLAQVACAASGKLYADVSYDSTENRDLCRHDGIQPHIRKIGEAHGSGLGRIRCVVEHDCAWLLANKRLDRRHDRRGHTILALLAAVCIFIVANRLDAF